MSTFLMKLLSITCVDQILCTEKRVATCMTAHAFKVPNNLLWTWYYRAKTSHHVLLFSRAYSDMYCTVLYISTTHQSVHISQFFSPQLCFCFLNFPIVSAMQKTWNCKIVKCARCKSVFSFAFDIRELSEMDPSFCLASKTENRKQSKTGLKMLLVI